MLDLLLYVCMYVCTYVDENNKCLCWLYRDLWLGSENTVNSCFAFE